MTGKELKIKLENIDSITLREIAERLSISEQNLQNKLTSADIKVSFLCKLSRVLHKSIYFFLEGQDFYEEKTVKRTKKNGETSMLRSDDAPVLSAAPSTDIPAASDTVVLRLMDKLDKKESQIDHLQSELRAMTEELATLKAKYPESSTSHPEGLGPAKTASTKKHSPQPDADNATSANAQ